MRKLHMNVTFDTARIFQKRELATIFQLAKKKGLKIQKNSFVAGWSVSLPSGGHYTAKDQRDLVVYVKGY